MEKKVSKTEQLLQNKLTQKRTPLSGMDALLGTPKAEDKTDETQEREPVFPEDIELLAKQRREIYKNVGRPKQGDDSKKGNKDKVERFTTILTHETADKVRAIAYLTSSQVKNVVETYLLRGIESFEKEYGKITIKKSKKI